MICTMFNNKIFHIMYSRIKMQFRHNRPVEAIQEGSVYTIDADACIDCGACEATCPNEAITEA